ncbi:cyanophycin synthetase [Bacillus sp. P14.5]|uniref:cyanophycin synthetase n=1 Tax=Bacillus sp. P14.5 TaxID=1983400 RepID=UPI000DEB2335|nr:cyanophycin synthetase [Bacillus sp. P14.5]
MKINRVRYLQGPNYFSYKPTMWIELDLEDLEYLPSNEIPGFPEALEELIPSLNTHTCSRGYEGAFIERLNEGTWMGHIMEHMALELQHLAGIKVKHGKTLTSKKKGIYFVTFDYKEKTSGLYSFKAAMEIVQRILDGETPFSVQPYIDRVSALYYENKLGPSTEAIYSAAQEKKIPVERIGSQSLLRLGTGSKQKHVQATITSQTSHLAVENACDKQAAKQILQAAGLPVPKGETAASREEVFAAADRIGYPLVLKPLHGRQGKGVITNIKNKEELFNALYCLEPLKEDLIIERFYDGSDYRLLVIDNKLTAASLRTAPFLIGNGKDTIEKLIEAENQNPLRGSGHEKPITKIPMNQTVKCFLESQDLSFQSVLEKGQIIQAVGSANLSTGGQAIDVTDEVHPSIKEIAENAAEAIGLDVAGVDLICRDITKPFSPETTAILEINAAPGIRMHLHPSKGKRREAGKDIVQYLFKDRKEASIPIISVTGTNGKTTTTRLVKHLLEGSGSVVGMTNSDGVYIGDKQIDSGDCSGPISARKVLGSPKTDFAVLETARGGILREGLAFRYCDVGIVTNVSEDHLGLDGIETFQQLVKLKRLIPEVVAEDGYCVLNADDDETVKMASHTAGTVIFTSLDESNPVIRKAIENDGTAWYVNREGMIIFHDKGTHHPFLPVCDVPITIEGTARHNVSNLLQALAASHSQGVTIEDLKERVLTFKPDAAHSRGRFNRTSIQGREIIVDYAHNQAGLKAIFDAVEHISRNRTITVISSAGDRQDSAIIEMSRIAASNSDSLIIKEDKDLRGRVTGEVPAIMLNEAQAHYGDPSCSPVILDETEAYQFAWDHSKEGDLLLFLYESFQAAEDFIKGIQDSKLYSDAAE